VLESTAPRTSKTASSGKTRSTEEDYLLEYYLQGMTIRIFLHRETSHFLSVIHSIHLLGVDCSSPRTQATCPFVTPLISVGNDELALTQILPEAYSKQYL